MARRSRKLGKLTIKNRREARAFQEREVKFPPRCFVFTRGNIGKDLKQLSHDFRQVMEPNTGSKLKRNKKNSIRDYLAVAGTLHVTHLIIFSQTDVGLYMKLMRIPNGPTLTFRITNYSLKKDVLSNQKRQYTPPTMLTTGPCLMTNLQPDDGPLSHQLSARMFLDLFPTITPNTAKTKTIQRCCLIHHSGGDEKQEEGEGQEEDEGQEEMGQVGGGGEFDLRHYSIRVVPLGLSRALRKVNKRKLPDLSGYTDVSEFMTKAGIGSESEGEDDPTAQVTVSSRLARRSRVTGLLKSSVKLSEIGPRLSLKLHKIEEGLLEGMTLYNRVISRSHEEKLQLEKKRRAKRNLKQKRKDNQEKNVETKKKKQEEHKKKCLEGMSKSGKVTKQPAEEEVDYEWKDVEDDDIQYYRQEVGEEPDIDLFQKKTGNRKRKMEDGLETKKKFKKNKDTESTGGDDEYKDMTRKERKEKKIMNSKKKKGNDKNKKKFRETKKKGKVWGESKIKKPLHKKKMGDKSQTMRKPKKN